MIKINSTVNKTSRMCLGKGVETYPQKTMDDEAARQNNLLILRQSHHLTMQEAKQAVSVDTNGLINWAS